MKDAEPVYATLSEFEPLDISWMWKPFIPYGMVTIMEGDPGIGKSFAAMKLASIVSTGGKLPDGTHVEKDGVLYVSAEDDPSYTIRPRIDAMGGNADLIRLQGKYSPFDDDGLRRLRSELRQHPAGLVVIDPLYAYVPSGSDMYKPNEIRAILTQLSEIAAEAESAFLLVRHLRKSKSDKAIYQGVGAIDVIAAARSAILVGVHPDEPETVVLAHLKHSLSRRGDSWGFRLSPKSEGEIPDFEWTGKVSLSADQLFTPQSGPSALEVASSFLREHLSTPKNAAMLQERAKKEGIASRTLDRAKSDLGVVAKKRGITWMWHLPPTFKNAKDASD